MTIRYGSVCSGIEAATRAFHALGWSPAFFAEIEKFPSAVLAHHYGSNMPSEPLATNGVPNYGDFTQIGADAGPVDLLVGGTPCQSFSVAGKRLGLDDPRGNLALEYLALARRLGARWILWENVPGVLSSTSDEEDGEGGVQPSLEGREAGDEWIEESDFATFLEFVRECGYGFAYRVLDAQYVRVDEFARAVPQRRKRVFVVGYLGDWRRAAAVLLEPESMRWNPPPSRKAGQSVAPTISARPSGGGGLGTDFDLDGGLIPFDTTQITSKTNVSAPQSGDPCHPLAAKAHPPAIAFGGGNTSGPIDVSTALTALTAHGHRIDFEVETFVAHALRGEGFDASEDGTGRGTPIVPIAFNPKLGSDPSYGLGVNDDGTSYTLDANGHSTAIAFQERGRSDGRSIEWQDDIAYSLNAPSGGGRRQELNIAAGWAVRRLTPRECERLQGFPDDFTSVPFNGKPAADGPRYKALGNSMAVNVMRWLGQRIDIMENLIQSGALDAAASTATGAAE